MSSPSPNRYPDSAASPSTERPQNPLASPGLPGRPGYQSKYRRGSGASIASSIGGLIDTSNAGISSQVGDLSHNAISTLLAHPIVRTGLIPQSSIAASGHKQPSVRDIPPVTLTTITHVDPSAFQPYLSSAGALHDRYKRLKTAVDDGASQLFRRNGPEIDEFAEAFAGVSRKSSQPSSPALSRKSSFPILSPLREVQSKRPSSSSGPIRKNTTGPAPLTTIPTVYFEHDFHLENPRTFDVVSERSDVIPPQEAEKSTANGSAKPPGQTGRKALHTNAILQEKLSWYMDTVEVHLIQAISTASTSFFAALGSLKELESEAAESVTRIQNMRSALKRLDEDMAVGGLKVVEMQRRKENLRTLSSAVSQICDIVEDAKKCDELVDEGSLESATKSIEALEMLIAGKSSSRPVCIDLRRVKALSGIAKGIEDLRFRVAKGFEQNFVETLLTDLRMHVKNVPQKNTLRRWANASLRSRADHKRVQSSPAEYLKNNESLRPGLVTALTGLANSGYTTRAATAYREAILREIKSMIRRNLPSSTDDDNESMASVSTSVSRGGRKLGQQEKSAILARNLRALDAESAEELLIKTYTSIGEALRRISFQVKVLLDVTSNMAIDAKSALRESSEPQIAIQAPSGQIEQLRDDVTSTLDLSSLLGQAVDVIQTQITKILNVRSEQSTKLDLEGFLKYFTLNLLFADECEAVSGKAGERLKEVVNSHVKDFLQNMAENEKLGACQTLDNDQWEAQDFTPKDNVVLSRVLESMTRTPSAWITYSSLWDDSTTRTNGNATESIGEAPAKARPAEIDSQRYIMVNSTFHALHALDKFGILMAGIPSLTPDASQKLLDYFRTFNSRCQQLVLGAGAIRMAGLKNINTKHLALASQTCSFLVALIPYIREFARRQCPASALAAILPEFDKVKRSLQDHQASIHEKVVDIITARSNVHLNAMKKVVWDEPSPSGEGVSPYMEALTKETGTLYRVLSRHVGEGDLLMVMSPIFRHFQLEWTKAFDAAVVKTEAGRARMLRDTELFEAKMSRLEGCGTLGEDLVKLAQSKKVEAPAPTPVSQPIKEASPLPSNTTKEQTPSEQPPTDQPAREEPPSEVVDEQAPEEKSAPPPPTEDEGRMAVAETEAAVDEAQQASSTATEPDAGRPKTSVELLGEPEGASKQ